MVQIQLPTSIHKTVYSDYIIYDLYLESNLSRIILKRNKLWLYISGHWQAFTIKKQINQSKLYD